MTQRDYCSDLLSKMNAEQNEYREWLLSQPPSEILKHTGEYTVREDILIEVEVMEISPKRAKALLKSPTPLADVVKEFRDSESSRMDEIRDSIESRADTVIKRESARESR